MSFSGNFIFDFIARMFKRKPSQSPFQPVRLLFTRDIIADIKEVIAVCELVVYYFSLDILTGVHTRIHC